MDTQQVKAMGVAKHQTVPGTAPTTENIMA